MATKAKLFIGINAVDGNERRPFPHLAAVARYLKGQDLGPDYRRPGYLQGEFGQFWFYGFRWSDVLQGNPFDDSGEYRPELLAQKPKLRWYHKPLTSPTAAYSDKWTAKADGEEWGDVMLDKPRDDGFDNPTPYHASFSAFGGANRDAHCGFATLEEAKAWIARLLTFGEEGYYKRLGYWDGIRNSRSDYYPLTKHSHLYAEGFELGLQNRPLPLKDRPRPEWA